MQLSAILTRDDITSAVEQLTPLRVALRSKRVISLGRPAKIELVAGAGLRMRGDARFGWDAYGITVPVTLRSWEVLLVPSIASRNGHHVLAFDPVLERLDFKSVPRFLDGRIADAIGEGLAAQKTKLAWDFEEHLSLVRALPDRLSPSGEVRLGPTGGAVTVTEAEVRLTLDFALHVRLDPLPASSRDADAGSRTSALGRRVIS
jgi:hypothetical protein